MPDVLVIDDQRSICFALEKLLEAEGHSVRTASSAEDGLALATERAPDLIFLDVRLPGMDGLTALPRFRQDICPQAKVVVITAHGTVDTAVEAIREGAFEYLLKPFDGPTVVEVARRAFAERPPSKTLTELQKELLAHPQRLIGRTETIQRVFAAIATVATGDAPVTILGESGTGKELVAREIHDASARREAPFVPVHVGALPETLLESELFGYVKGAFTGAQVDRAGLMEAAAEGTLFLDEIAEIPLASQSKLLRVMQDGEFRRLGDNATYRTTCRVIAASNQPLKTLVDEGRFREDLYYRVAVTTVELPPLRARLADINWLVAGKLNAEGHEAGATEALLSRLKAYPWPGNVRELHNVLEHAMLNARDRTLDVAHLPPYLHQTSAPASLEGVIENLLAAHADDPPGQLYETVLAAFEEPLLRKVLATHAGNQLQAAKVLGIHRSTLKTKLDKYGLDPKTLET